MRVSGIIMALACAAMFMAPTGASAQATRTWISGVGDDVNPCSRTAPCKTFPGAISKTAAGGEIDTLDPGGFGAVTVTKAITLADEGVGEGGILVAGTNGITVNCATDPTCTVVVRGLQIDGGPIGSNSLSGIKFIAGRALIVDNCEIRNFTGGSPNGYGIWFNPSATQTYVLTVRNTTIHNNGPTGGTGGGIFVNPSSGSGTVYASIINSQVDNNGFGIAADASTMTAATGAGLFVTVTDTDASGNQFGGVASVTLGAVVNVNVNRSVINGNGVGFNVKNTGAIGRIGNSTITNNANGFKNTGVLTTYGTNQIDNPTSTATPTPSSPS
jgi:hypothetical protein